MIVCRSLIARTDDHTHYITFFIFLNPSGIYLPRVKIIIIIRLITRAMSEYMTESEAQAVARWDVGSCLRMVHKTKQVGFEPVFESLHRWSISYGGWDFIPNFGSRVAEGTPTKVSCYSWNTERGLIKKQK